jgi:putative membrane-bound dehydrogenase-like protein
MKRTVLLVFLCVTALTRAEPVLQVPAGFTIQPVAGPPQIAFPMFGTLDDRHRLYVTESSGNDLYAELLQQVRKCRVSVLEDLDGDGRYEKAAVFVDKLTPSMGLVWRDRRLYLADPPDLVALEDTDGDGRADKRTVILTGFGHTDNGSLHGLTFGPDGWLYFTTGNPDGYDLHGPDGSHAKGQAGALLRCRPDGSGVETLCRGFENLVEIVFLPDGSLIGTDTWYQLPDRGIRDALVHLLEAGIYPIHPLDKTVSYLQFNGVLPPVALFPAVAHSGLEIYHGETFPPGMKNNLFSAQHNTRKIVRHELLPKGSSYGCETFDFVTTDDPDVHFSDVLQDADGSLLVIDTGSWYVQHCPTGRIRNAPARGGIYRVSFQNASRRPSVPADAFSTNWLAQLESTNATVTAAAARMVGRLHDTNAAPGLLRLLSAKNPALRLAAAEAIAYCGTNSAVPVVEAALGGDTDAFLEHALTFALYHLATTSDLTRALGDPQPKVQRAAMLLLDQAPFSASTAPVVVKGLHSEDPALRDTARWVLLRHPEWGNAGAACLRSLLANPHPTDADRRALAQILPVFATNALVLAAMADTLASTNSLATDAQRIQLLDALDVLSLPEPPTILAHALLRTLGSPSASVALAGVHAVGALRIPDAEAALTGISRDNSRPPGLRLDALRELVRRQPGLDTVSMDFLLDQLAPTNGATARLAAFEVMSGARLTSPQILALLGAVRTDPVIAPGAVLQLIEHNGLPADCSVTLLDYLAVRLDAGWTVSVEKLEKVQAVVPQAQRPAVAGLTERLSQSIARQREQLTQMAPLLNGGDTERGEKVFFEKGQCLTCHRIWENGGRVGPDLTKLGAIRSGRDILESILVPSSTIAQGYETLVVTTRDGETYVGIRVGAEDGPVRLRLASGSEVAVSRSDIDRIDRSKVSLMPEGLLNSLPQVEVRDLLAFLQHLK